MTTTTTRSAAPSRGAAVGWRGGAGPVVCCKTISASHQTLLSLLLSLPLSVSFSPPSFSPPPSLTASGHLQFLLGPLNTLRVYATRRPLPPFNSTHAIPREALSLARPFVCNPPPSSHPPRNPKQPGPTDKCYDETKGGGIATCTSFSPICTSLQISLRWALSGLVHLRYSSSRMPWSCGEVRRRRRRRMKALALLLLLPVLLRGREGSCESKFSCSRSIFFPGNDDCARI